jgi:hypothetical protein
VDIETDPESEKLVIEKNQGKGIIPTIVFGDGSFLSEPTNADRVRKLSLKTKAARSDDDLALVGAGPAGSGSRPGASGWRFSRPRTWTGFTHTTGTGALERPRGANTAPKPS